MQGAPRRKKKNIRILAEIEQALVKSGFLNFRFSIVGQGGEERRLKGNLRRTDFAGVLSGEALARAAENPQKLWIMREAARAYASRASWDTVFDGLYAAYERGLRRGFAARKRIRTRWRPVEGSPSCLIEE